MTKIQWRNLAWPVVVAALISPFMVNCGSLPAVPGGLPGVPKCPDTASIDALASFDYVKELGVQADVGAKLKSGVIAAVSLKGMADQVDADLKVACSGLAADLGAKGDFPSGTEACKAAIKAMDDIKVKMGAGAKLALDIKPPVCGASMDMMADCAAHCDASLSGGKAKVECEPGKLQGSCDAKCEGSCDMTAAAACDGSCSGTCDAQIKGTCNGNCNGKCDGKNSTAACAGTCEGKCDAKVEGTCSGKCGGTCKLKAGGSCQGTCTGKCSAEMKAPKCTGEVTPPKMSAECKGQCDAQVNAKVECSPATVAVRITGAADAKAADQFKAALEKNFPAILKVAIGLGDKAVKIAGSIKDIVASVQSSVEASVKAGGASGAMVAGKIAGCFGAQFKGAADAAGSLKANVDVSVSVKASASASGSASGKAGG